MQRLRVRFSRAQEIKFISHLDMVRLWQRTLHRSALSLAYSEGFSPHPRISLAAPLAVGVTSEAELMDLFCIKQTSPHGLTTMVKRELPAGIEILQVHQIALTLPSLQSQIRHTEYRVEVKTKKEKRDIETALTSLLTTTHLPWHHQRDTGLHSYDLRILISNLWLIDRYQEYCTIGMKLRCDSSGSGRPEQVISALGFAHYPQLIHRTKLILG